MVRMASASSRDQALPAADSPLRALAAILVSARPGQWIKNLVLPLPFLFGGALSSARGWAIAVAIPLVLAGLAAAFALSWGFGGWCAIYVALMIGYSLWLKSVPFLEALIVAGGLPLGGLAGAALARVPAAPF